VHTKRPSYFRLWHKVDIMLVHVAPTKGTSSYLPLARVINSLSRDNTTSSR
jgi:hypothetical protein